VSSAIKQPERKRELKFYTVARNRTQIVPTISAGSSEIGDKQADRAL
jgi:hypothetical protein